MPESSERGARVWVMLPTYNEAENLERIVTAVLEHLPDSAGCWSSTTTRRTAPGRSPIAWPSARRRLRAAPPAQGGPRTRLPGRLSRGARRRRRADRRDGRRLLARSRATCRPCSRAASDADLVLGSRYVHGGGVTDWGALRRLISRGGSTYARVDARDRRSGPDRRLQVLPPRGARERSTSTRSRRAATPSRSRPPTGRSRTGFRVVEIPIVFSDRTEGTSKMSRSIVAEAMWRVPGMRLRGAGDARFTMLIEGRRACRRLPDLASFCIVLKALEPAVRRPPCRASSTT